MSAFIHKDDYIYTSSNETQVICQSLFSTFDINIFNYYRFFKSGHFYGLVTTPDLVQYHTSNNYILSPLLDNQPVKNKFHYLLLPDLKDGFSQVVHDYRQYFNVFYPLYLFERSHDYFDLFVYHHSGSNSTAFDYYMSNMNHLEKWKLKFKEKAAYLLSIADKNRILIPEHLRPNEYYYDCEDKPCFDDLAFKPFNLTHREIDCARYLIDGLSAKMIGKRLGLSHRTIETHINNIKIKTKSINKYDAMMKLCFAR